MNLQITNTGAALDALTLSGAVIETTPEEAASAGAFDEAAIDLADAIAAVADEGKEARHG